MSNNYCGFDEKRFCVASCKHFMTCLRNPIYKNFKEKERLRKEERENEQLSEEKE